MLVARRFLVKLDARAAVSVLAALAITATLVACGENPDVEATVEARIASLDATATVQAAEEAAKQAAITAAVQATIEALPTATPTPPPTLTPTATPTLTPTSTPTLDIDGLQRNLESDLFELFEKEGYIKYACQYKKDLGGVALFTYCEATNQKDNMVVTIISHAYGGRVLTFVRELKMLDGLNRLVDCLTNTDISDESDCDTKYVTDEEAILMMHELYSRWEAFSE